ncbi:MAG: PQQ-binding-like beta-propeller repeat protein [Acidobacteriota bacterium]
MKSTSLKWQSSLLLMFVLAGHLVSLAQPGEGAKKDPAAHWPQWRGPNFDGLAPTAVPVQFGDDRHVKWKVAIAGRGFSTPVIWGDRIFLTTAMPTGNRNQSADGETANGADRMGGGRRGGGAGGGAGAGEEHRFIVMCLDRRSGKMLWEQVATTATPHEGYHRQYGSFASHSPATDGRAVYASFGSRGVYAYDFNGRLLWKQDLGIRQRMRLQFGEGSAPLLIDNQLILNYDQESGSQIVALDKRNGRLVWRVDRDEASSWSMPYALTWQGRRQIVLAATNRTRAYDPSNGRVIWECGGLGANVIPSPVLNKDLLIVMSGYRDPRLMAIRLGREGDLTGSDAVAWSHTRGTAYTPSPVLFENRYYVLSDNGLLHCYNATTGEPYYQQKRLPEPDSFKASPIGADGKLYIASESGVVTVLKMGEQFEVLATNRFNDQMFISSPVVAVGELFLRSATHLFCISEKKQVRKESVQ